MSSYIHNRNKNSKRLKIIFKNKPIYKHILKSIRINFVSFSWLKDKSFSQKSLNSEIYLLVGYLILVR